MIPLRGPNRWPARGGDMRSVISILVLVTVVGCAESRGSARTPTTPPPASPSAPVPATSDYVLRLDQLEHIDAGPGEDIHLMRGDRHGFDSLSIIMTDTSPKGGPPLHVHDSEEAHVVYEGVVEYVVGSRRFTANGPYVARVPAGVPHTFVNAGSAQLRLVAVFPDSNYTFKVVGPNPLWAAPVKE